MIKKIGKICCLFKRRKVVLQLPASEHNVVRILLGKIETEPWKDTIRHKKMFRTILNTFEHFEI